MLLALLYACSNRNANKSVTILPEEFNAFYQKIDKMKEIDDSKQMVFFENDAPASFKYIETENGMKYSIGYTGSLGRRTIRYFYMGKNIYIEDVNIEYNKIYNYEDDSTKLEFIKQDTSKYFLEDLFLIRFCDTRDSVLVENQMNSELIVRSKDLLAHLKKVKQKSGL